MDSLYPKIETSFVFTNDMNDELGNSFNRKIFGFKNTEDLTASSGLVEIKYFYPENIILQHVPVTEKVGKQEVNKLRVGFITDT